MKNLIDFLLRHSSWFVFAFFAFISCWLLFKNNPYQQHIYLTSANAVTASIYKGASNVTSYFNLQSINADLQERNALLEMEVLSLKKQIRNYHSLENPIELNFADDSIVCDYEYHFANVINNSVSKPKNYITLDKGSLDGIEKDMGVVDQNGVVGIVCGVSDHAARVISLLNPDMHLSCKIKNLYGFPSRFCSKNTYCPVPFSDTSSITVISGGTPIRAGNIVSPSPSLT